MPFRDVAWGRFGDLAQTDHLKAGVAEFFSTLFFVFIGEGSSLAFVKVSGSTTMTPNGLLIAALCHGFAIYAAISISFHVSGGHVNPAVTLGLFVGGYITLLKGVLYILAQLAGAAVGSLLLEVVTDRKITLPVHTLAEGEPLYSAVLMEIVLTFILLYTIYATAVDSRAKSTPLSMPLVVGLTVAAIIMFGAPYEGASMNPARSFGPALVAWQWKDHWVYWVGPLVGGGLAGLVYELVFIECPTHKLLLHTEEY